MESRITALETLRQAAKNTHYDLNHAWEEKGPPNTMIEYHGACMISDHLFYYQEFKHGGFEIFNVTSRANDIDKCREAVEAIIKS